MAYSILKINKIKSMNILRQAGDHHFRFTHPTNSNESIEALNDEAITLKGETIIEDWNARLNSLPYYENRRPGKNAVLAYDILVSYSPEASRWLDVNQWKEDNEKWLKDTFGEENVLSLVYHYDEASASETGTIHGHAIVIPIDEKGHLNSGHFIKGREDYAAIQDSYAESMSVHGLERGIPGSKRINESSKHFYARVRAAAEKPVPERQERETEAEHAERLEEAFRKERAGHIKENERIQGEIESEKEKQRDTESGRKLEELSSEYTGYLAEEKELIHEFGSLAGAKKEADSMKKLISEIDSCMDEEAAENLSNNIDILLNWDEGRKKQKKEKLEQEVLQE